jgi:signal peptidase II
MRLTPKSRSWTALLIVVLAIVIDQVIKILVKTNMSLGDSIPVFGDWFQIRFIENNGMAFGMEFIGKTFLTLFRLVVASLLVWYLRVIAKDVKSPFGYVVCISLVLAGAFGNIIDCLFYGEIFSSSYNQVAEFVPWGEGYASFLHGRVVDMFYFPLFTWPDWVPLLGGGVFFAPVFNFADACISCSVVALIIWYRGILMNK